MTKVAYFSMEIFADESIPTFAGGLGVLAGDYLRSAADSNAPLIGVSLLSRRGYFRQALIDGKQHEFYESFDPSTHMRELAPRVSVRIDGADVTLRAWQYDMNGRNGTVPIIFLDAALPENRPWDADLTGYLYGADKSYRLKQELLLGVGGVRMLQALGIAPKIFHLNEGHGGFVPVELLRQGMTLEDVREHTVFTTHTPVPAGHDRFAYDEIDRTLKDIPPQLRSMLVMLGGTDDLNMTHIAMNASKYVNGVSQLHAEVSRKMFPYRRVNSITNGVHSFTWTSPEFQSLYDTHIPGWRDDPCLLTHSRNIPSSEILAAHAGARSRLVDLVKDKTGVALDLGKMTVGFARRAATYKRADLLFTDMDELVRCTQGNVQFVFAGKAHPQDVGGKQLIERINGIASHLSGRVPVVFVENYSPSIGAVLTAGSDVWLNTPIRGQEASGTSGMKAAHNGVPHLSTSDGWWPEGSHQGGWSIGDGESNAAADSHSLYGLLRSAVLPSFRDPERFVPLMRGAIANAGYFNTHRMLKEYFEKAYELPLQE